MTVEQLRNLCLVEVDMPGFFIHNHTLSNLVNEQFEQTWSNYYQHKKITSWELDPKYNIIHFYVGEENETKKEIRIKELIETNETLNDDSWDINTEDDLLWANFYHDIKKETVKNHIINAIRNKKELKLTVWCWHVENNILKIGIEGLETLTNLNRK